jgi:hypothetical protein
VGYRYQDSGYVDHHRRRKVGRNHRCGRPSLPTPPHYGGKEILALRSGETPHLFDVETPRQPIEAVRVVEMSPSNAWAEFAAMFYRTRKAYLDHDAAKTELKKLMPEEAKEATGHGVRARRSKSGAVSFDIYTEGGHAAPQ